MQKDPRPGIEPRTFLLQGNSATNCATVQPLDPLHENEQSLAELVTYYNMENINQRSSQEAHCKSGGASEICCSGRRENLFEGQLLVVHFTNMAFIEKWQVGS
ncbi:hypothetical protein ILYODFUR_000276 [Ilyodon furcidens]|uniref:Uncharacterized protein n=1 Tax=Ilyodon furcidens TaxID=33524 RepID=A0ABV0SHB8_9TELE